MEVKVKEIVTRVDIETKHLKLNDMRGSEIHELSYQSPSTTRGIYGQVNSTSSGLVYVKFYDDDLGMVTIKLEPSHKHQEENSGKFYQALDGFFTK